MDKIKQRETVKDIKVLDKSALLSQRMKNALVQTRRLSESPPEDSTNPSDYAEVKIRAAGENVLSQGQQTLSQAKHRFVQARKEQKKQKEVLQQKNEEAIHSLPSSVQSETFDPIHTDSKSASLSQPSASRSTGSTARPLQNPSRPSSSPSYAKEQPRKMAQDAARKAVRTTESAAKQTVQTARDAAARTVRTADATARRTVRATGKAAQKTVEHTERAVRKTAKGTIKTAQKSIKTAEKTARVTIKTTEKAIKVAEQSAKAAARAAKAAAQAARTAAKVTVAAVKLIIKAVVTLVKLAVAAVKGLIALIASGGWTAVLIIVIICLIGAIVASCYGIFFSNEDADSENPMQAVVREINDEYTQKLDEIKSSATYDSLEMSGSRAVWSEVLAVYAVKVTTDEGNPQEVVTMDDAKKQILKDIFWQMNEIASQTETAVKTVTVETDDGEGNIIETETEVKETVLRIAVSHRTANEMADLYNFTRDQREQLAALLDAQNRSLWSEVLYGISGGSGDIVEVALSQVGNVGGEPYWSWYGFGGRVEWCACFVSWCANECGYIDVGVIPKFAGCDNGVQWFKDRGLWQDNSYEPRPGDIIFFDWDDPGGFAGAQDGASDHVGIVKEVDGGRVYTVEGNSGDSCRENSYPIGYYEVLGYGCPAY